MERELNQRLALKEEHTAILGKRHSIAFFQWKIITCFWSFYRIDWQYRSPDGKLYNNLKTVLSVIRQKCVKYERWELVAPVTKEKSETHGKSQYVTLRQQYEDELDRALDTDVFAVRWVIFTFLTADMQF